MEDKTKAEKRAAGRLLLKQYQKKNKDGKFSPSPVSSINNDNNTTVNSDQKINEQLKNGHLDEETVNITQTNTSGKDSVRIFTFQKDESPAEQFFDSFRPSPQQSSPDHSEKGDPNIQGMSPVQHYHIHNSTDRLKDLEKHFEYSSSSRSSRSDDDALKRLMEGQLNSEILVKEELEKKLLESTEKTNFYENEMKRLTLEVDKLRIQQAPLEEKVGLHMKTIEILVGEKSELQQELTKLREEYMRDRNKNEDISMKLKFSQDQVEKLKNELSEISEAREQHNTILKKLEHSLADANNNAELNRKEVIDAKEEIKFLKHKAEQMGNHCMEMKKQLDEKDKQLSMAEMRLAQLGAGGIPTKADVNRIDELEKECVRLNEEIAKLVKDKADTVSQYQQYIDTINSQVLLVNEQYESCLISKNQLLTREESLVKHISELEKRVQKEHQAGPSLTETNNRLNRELKEANNKMSEIASSLNEKNEEVTRLTAALNETTAKLNEAEISLERLEVPDARKLQAAMENDRVAATRAVQQNNQLKQHVIELQEAIVRLNNEKLALTEKWQHVEYLLSEQTREMQKYKGRQEIEVRDAVAQSTVVFHTEQSSQADIDDLDIPISTEHVTPESMNLLEKKLKKTMNDYANLYDEKQRLEHMVLHLQSETETIGEYVTLYQNQRSLLQERAMERDRQMAAVAKEREELKQKLAQINALLPQIIEESGPVAVHSKVPGSQIEDGPTSKIKTLLNEIETSSLVKDSNIGIQNNFHPCLLCSGKLINI